MQPYQKPNFKTYFDGYKHDVYYTLSCEGLSDEPGCRLSTTGVKRIELIKGAMEFVGLLFGPRYAPSIEQTEDGDDGAGYVRFVFDTIELSYRSFQKKYDRLFDNEGCCKRINEAGFDERFLGSAYVAYWNIWDIFYDDVAVDSLDAGFREALALVDREIRNQPFEEDGDEE